MSVTILNVTAQTKDEQDISDISIAMKAKKKLTLLAIKNNSDTEVFAFEIKVSDGSIRFIKAKGWNREKIDSATVRIQTSDQPITEGRTMIVLMVLDKTSAIGWRVFDAQHNTISTGIIGEQPKHEREKPQQEEQGREQSATQSSASQTEFESLQLIAELQNVSIFGTTVRTETLCVEKLNWAISWAGGVHAVRVHGVNNSFYEEVRSMPNNIVADKGGCFFVFPVSADGSGAVWVYGDKNIAVKKYLPEPNADILDKIKNAKHGYVTLGDEPNRVGYSMTYNGVAMYKYNRGTTGKIASGCIEQSDDTSKAFLKVNWIVEGHFNNIQVYRDTDNGFELVYESNEPKDTIYIYDVGCYHAYIDTNSMPQYYLEIMLGLGFDK